MFVLACRVARFLRQSRSLPSPSFVSSTLLLYTKAHILLWQMLKFLLCKCLQCPLDLCITVKYDIQLRYVASFLYRPTCCVSGHNTCSGPLTSTSEFFWSKQQNLEPLQCYINLTFLWRTYQMIGPFGLRFPAGPRDIIFSKAFRRVQFHCSEGAGGPPSGRKGAIGRKNKQWPPYSLTLSSRKHGDARVLSHISSWRVRN